LTIVNATVFGERTYGIKPGAEGSVVVFDAHDPFHALWTRAHRVRVIRRGIEIARATLAETTAATSERSHSPVGSAAQASLEECIW
jgi:cytosine deaminase